MYCLDNISKDHIEHILKIQHSTAKFQQVKIKQCLTNWSKLIQVTIKELFNVYKMGPKFQNFPTNRWVFCLKMDIRHDLLSKTWLARLAQPSMEVPTPLSVFKRKPCIKPQHMIYRMTQKKLHELDHSWLPEIKSYCQMLSITV